MAQIFLSYARKDAQRARAIADTLEGCGWSVWWDRHIPPGQDFRTFTQNQIDIAACVVVLWSTASVESQFVRDEASEGLGGRLVPALIEKVKPPLGFRQLQTADLSEWTGDARDEDFLRFARSIETIVSRQISSVSSAGNVNPVGDVLVAPSDQAVPVVENHGSPEVVAPHGARSLPFGERGIHTGVYRLKWMAAGVAAVILIAAMVVWLRPSAPTTCEEGAAADCYRQGLNYVNGTDGKAQDLAQAVALFQKACDGGSAEACDQLGYRYENGDGGLPRDVNRAVALYRKACDGGHATACTSLLALPPVAAAQGPVSELQTAGGLHSAVFRTPQGSITVHVSADAAAGDTISGLVLVESVGATPQEQEANLGVLSRFVVELQKQETKVSTRRYEWSIPIALRTGAAILFLRDGSGREVAQLRVPVDPVAPARPAGVSTTGEFDIPSEGQIGRPAVVRGPLNGSFTGKAVTVDGRPAELLASSPRQIVFRVPAATAGPLPVRVRSGDVEVRETLRVLGVRLAGTSTQLLRGQTATLTLTAAGLGDLKEPVTLTLINGSADVVSVQDGNSQTMTIQPRQVQADGTFTVTRRLIGIRAGDFHITARVASAPFSQFEEARATDRTMDDWQASTGVRIAADARDLIRRSILDARQPLEDFLRRQEAQQGDIQAVFDFLVRHYCFDLRDEMFQATRATVAAIGRPRLLLASLRQPAQAGPEITVNDVRRWSFSQFLSRVISRFSTQPVGYLYVSSQPERAPITIDGQRNSEVTNRRFVTSVGNHVVLVARPAGTCRETVSISAFQTGVVACDK